MKAIVSSTYDDKYLFFLPIVSWCWHKLGIDTICFAPSACRTESELNKFKLVLRTIEEASLNVLVEFFSCPQHKESTYAQISRMYASSLPGISNDEVLISSDVDMAVLKNIFNDSGDVLWNMGFDLVPDGQLPMCFSWGKAWVWDFRFGIKGKSMQECLDEQLANEDSIHMRGDLWSRDQEIMAKAFAKHSYESTVRIPRAREGTTFANHRLDRDDAYLLDRLSPDIIDFHMPRPGHEEANFNIILTVLKYYYPNDDFQWLIDYRNEYIKLL